MYLVVGANGFLGSYIVKKILDKTDDKVIAIARNISVTYHHPRVRWISCDIGQRTDVDDLCNEIKIYNEIKTIFPAAYHNPDLVEKNPDKAWDINVTALSYCLNHIPNQKCLFYPSTDSVYGNSINGYRFKESDSLNPVNTYGRQKCAAESLVVWHGYNVVRFPFLIGPSQTLVKKHFYDVIEEKLKNGQSIEMFKDSFRSSMSFDLAAELLIELIEQHSVSLPQILNICGDDDLSKFDVGLIIADKLGVDRKLVIPINTTTSKGIFEAKRAQSTLMDNSKLKSILNLQEIKLAL